MIEIDHIDKWYGDFAVLKACTTSVTKGEVVVVCGPSGSGKSTLMNVLGCLDTPSSGDYVLDGALVIRDSISNAATAQGVVIAQ